MKAVSILAAGFAALPIVVAAHAGEGMAVEEGRAAVAWSEESNGLRGRLAMRRGYVFNGTGMVITHLELENVSDVSSAMIVDVEKMSLAFRVTDAAGNDVPQKGGAFDGSSGPVSKLMLPVDSSIRFRIGPCGWGVPSDQAALVDLGHEHGWVLPKDGQRYYLQGVLKIAKEQAKRDDGYERRWHGRLELPPVLIPTGPVPHDPATVGPLVEKLGQQMLSKSYRESEAAVRELSLIDDPRVVPWYVKAVESDRYDLKFAGLDRLARLDGDEALAGLKLGAATTGEQFGDVTKGDLAESQAKNIRQKAFNGLARSSHPQARAALAEYLEDPDETIRGEVRRLLGRDHGDE